MNGSTISLIFLGVIAVLGLLGAFKGYTRGFARQFIRTLTVVGSAALALYVAKMTYYDGLLPFFEGKTMGDIINELGAMGVLPADTDLGWLSNFDAEVARYLITLPLVLVVTPILFVVLFVIISALALIIHAAISGLFGFRKKRNNGLTRLLGTFLGAVQGVAVALLLLTPIIGYGTVYAETVETMKQETPENETVIMLSDTYDAYLRETMEHPVTKISKTVGVDYLFDYLVTVWVDDATQITMTDNIPSIASIYSEWGKLAGADWKALTPEQENAIKAILAKMDENDYLSTVIAGTLRGFARCYANGVISIELEEPFKSLIDSAIEIFETSDKDNLYADLSTLAEVYFIMSREGVLAAFGEDSEALLNAMTAKDSETGKTPINKVVETINTNARIKPLVTMFTRLSVTLMTKELNFGEETMQIYDNVKVGLSDTLKISKEGKSEEEYIAEVSSSIDATLQENGIVLEPEILDSMANYVSENLSGTEEITDDEINDLILSYYDAYVENNQGGDVPDIPDLPIN